jgi:ferredoxin
MKLTRRNILRRSLKGAAAALAALTTVGGAQWLLRGRGRSYPAHPRPTGADFVPGELDASIRAAGASAQWNPDWSARLIRPPGALERDRDFLAACIRCYRCQDACEPGAIQFFTERHGRHYHTPYVDPAIKACEPCMKCTQVCPTHALTPLTREQLRDVRMATVELREDLCLSFKAKRIRDEQAMMMELGREPTETESPVERRGPCGECYMFCPVRERAIRLEPGAFLAPIVFPDQCIGCGMCEEICRVMVRGEPAIRVVPIRSWT